MIIDITPDDLDTVLAENKAVIVDFWAPWCGPCLRIAPVLITLSKRYPGLVIAKLDLDEYAESAEGLGIMSIPTLRGYVNGELVKTVIGAQGNLKDEFLDVLIASE